MNVVEEILKEVDVLFGLRPVSDDAFLSFLDPPPQRDEVVLVTTKLTIVYLAWKIAGDGNPAVASFKGDTLESLRNEIHRVNRNAIDAARNGSELQRTRAVHNSRKDLTNAFYMLNRELGIQRAKYDFAGQVRGNEGRRDVEPVSRSSEQDSGGKELNTEATSTSAKNSMDNMPYLGLRFHDDLSVSRDGDAYKDKETCLILLSPQQFKILKFIHGAGEAGRTKSQMDAAGFTSLKQEKTKINEKLIPIELRFEYRQHKLIHIGIK
ncbi:MAG: hypothetical protein JNL58_14175 [Planctomyces sp.]|nr:hypothetical protein [Planctomyces sp.]